jgi:dihydroneopterin aldolase/2-amino-4-hydroxy-6-hydroxymethyldihydropteridine diphosphokinase
MKTIVEQVSSYQITAPVGGVEQDDFLNAAVALRTLRTPEELLELIGSIEQEQKRERSIHWGPRTIDLDILLYDSDIIQTKHLMIPHVEMQNRMFVLDPMCEIAPYTRHPLEGLTMQQLREKLMVTLSAENR